MAPGLAEEGMRVGVGAVGKDAVVAAVVVGEQREAVVVVGERTEAVVVGEQTEAAVGNAQREPPAEQTVVVVVVAVAHGGEGKEAPAVEIGRWTCSAQQEHRASEARSCRCV